jgi:thiamine-phosphate pyrophosphorylase
MIRAVGRFHVVTDASLQQRWTHVQVAHLAAAGGADVVQFREKHVRKTAELVRLARAVQQALPEAVQLIVNDRVDVAAEIGAHGVHLGRDDLAIETARRLLPRALIGGTANNLGEAQRCTQRPLDYIGAGPVFGTRSKSNPAPPLGLDGLAAIVRAVDCPVIAIGDITPERVGSVLEAGAHGIAVLSGVACSDDPAAAAARYREALDACASASKGES